MRVRLSEHGMASLKGASAYAEFVTGRPEFEVEVYTETTYANGIDESEEVYLHRLTGCTFARDEVEPA